MLFIFQQHPIIIYSFAIFHFGFKMKNDIICFSSRKTHKNNSKVKMLAGNMVR